MLKPPRLQYVLRRAIPHLVERDAHFPITDGAEVDSAALTKGLAGV